MPAAPSELKEYRCECGKLLFKGCLLISLVEVKCKSCGRLMLFRGVREESVAQPDRYVLMLDKQANIMDASFNAQYLLGYDQAELFGQSLSVLVPHITVDVLGPVFSRMWALPDRADYLFEMEATHRKKDGSSVPGMFRWKFVQTPHGELCFSVFRAAGPHADVPEPEFANMPKFRPFTVRLNPLGTMLSLGEPEETHLGKASKLQGKPLASMIADEAGRMKLAAKLGAKRAFSLSDIRLRLGDGSIQKMELFVLPRIDGSGEFQYYRTFFYTPAGPLKELA
jgi:hypothetical protein